MAYYLVRARLKPEREAEFQARLEHGEFRSLSPFGETLTNSLLAARRDPASGDALWEELCYCSPPLKQEREEVLDHYFDRLSTERVERGDGRRRIEGLPAYWT
jgi:hypothetical protein